jgi:hypothetical protein
MTDLEKDIAEMIELELPIPKYGSNMRFRGLIAGIEKGRRHGTVAVTLESPSGRREVVEVTPAGIRREIRRNKLYAAGG